MAVNRDRRRELRLLATANEAIMLAHGFTIEMLDASVRDGLATAERREMRAGRQPLKVIWLTITESGDRRSPDDAPGAARPEGRYGRPAAQHKMPHFGCYSRAPGCFL
jgi:hypothetical protein